MKKSELVKENIIEVTIVLINESKGDITSINTRKIAERAGVGVGFINYHFQTKMNLINICVERMIGGVISEFKPTDLPSSQRPIERLKYIAKLVADFLWDHPAVSRISILSDLENPKKDDNTIKFAIGFSQSLTDMGVSGNENFILSFSFTVLIQTLFLRRELSGELFGKDINIKKQRDVFLDLIIEGLYGGVGHE